VALRQMLRAVLGEERQQLGPDILNAEEPGAASALRTFTSPLRSAEKQFALCERMTQFRRCPFVPCAIGRRSPDWEMGTAPTLTIRVYAAPGGGELRDSTSLHRWSPMQFDALLQRHSQGRSRLFDRLQHIQQQFLL